MTKATISPYALSTFGRAFEGAIGFSTLVRKPDASMEEVRAAWDQLQPNINRLLCIADESDGALSLMGEKVTGMATAEAQGLPPECSETWDRLRVLQGLLGHAQMWLLCSAHFVVTTPSMADMFSYNARRLICEIFEVLCSNDAIEEVEDWVDAVICKAQEEHAAEAAPSIPVEDTRVVLDGYWKRHMLDGTTLVRDGMGCGDHPALPELDEGMKPKQFFDALGIELESVMAESQMDSDAYESMEEAADCSAWTPCAPPGEGWALVAIFHTEDGPAAWWMREAKRNISPDTRPWIIERDAARYRTLRSPHQGIQSIPFPPHVVHGHNLRAIEGNELDAAVDAINVARAAQGDA